MQAARLSLPLAVLSVLALTLAPLASSTSRAGTATTVHLRFEYRQVLPTIYANVYFTQGVEGIDSHTATVLDSSSGTIRVFTSIQEGFALVSGKTGRLDAAIDIDVRPAAGASAIEAFAPALTSATLTVQVNKGAATPVSGNFTIPLAGLLRRAGQPSRSSATRADLRRCVRGTSSAAAASPHRKHEASTNERSQ
jgi:hypothetical protein